MWNVLLKWLLILFLLVQERNCYIEKVEETGSESDMIMLTCRHLESIIAVVEATFHPSNKSLFDRPTVFPPFHPRLALNKRCSGVNHCSFILNKDCPGADKWGEGNVTIKYVCISGKEEERRINKYCNQNLTLGPQENGLAAPEGFIHNPGYPRFYLGHPDSCRWNIIAPTPQKVKITILDLSIIGPPRDDEDCKDILEIKEQDYVIYSSCQQEQPPMEIISKGNSIQVSFTSMETIVPTRGLLFQYTLVGCIIPKLPQHMFVLYRDDVFLELACRIGWVFSDTKDNRKNLTCLGYKWNTKLPLLPCEESDNFTDQNIYIVKTPHPTMSDDLNEAIVIPAVIIAFLFIINAIVVFFIFRRRKLALTTITEEEMQVVNGSNLA